MLVVQRQGVMVVLGLLQVGPQVDRLIAVGGPEVEVTDKYLGPEGRCQQQWGCVASACNTPLL